MSEGQMQTPQSQPRNSGRGAARGLGAVGGPAAGAPGAGRAQPGALGVRPASWGVSRRLSFPTPTMRRLGSWGLDAPTLGRVGGHAGPAGTARP